MKTKRGISLVILVILMLVMLILSTSIIVNASKAKETAQNITLVNEIKTLQEEIKKEFATTGKLPVLTENYVGESVNEILEKVDENDRETLKKQIEKKSDYDEKFIKITLKDIGIKTSVRGLEKLSNKDVFYLTKGSLNVYYLEGLRIDNNKVYAYIDEDEIKITEETLGYVELEKVFKVKKLIKVWSNSIDFDIDVELLDTENLFVELLNATNQIVYTQDITDNSYSKTFRITNTLTNPGILNSVRKARFIIKNGVTEVAKKEIEVNNIDITAPTYIPSKTSKTKVDGITNVSMYFLDGRSGVEKIVYLPKDELDYVEQDEYTAFILNKGKSAYATKTENEYEYVIEINNLNSKEYIAVCVDKANNILENLSIK